MVIFTNAKPKSLYDTLGTYRFILSVVKPDENICAFAMIYEVRKTKPQCLTETPGFILRETVL